MSVAIKPLLDSEPDTVVRKLPAGFSVRIERDGPERHFTVFRLPHRRPGYPRYFETRADAEMFVNRVLDEEVASE